MILLLWNADKGGEGVKNPENLADVICEWPLMSICNILAFKMVRVKTYPKKYPAETASTRKAAGKSKGSGERRRDAMDSPPL